MFKWLKSTPYESNTDLICKAFPEIRWVLENVDSDKAIKIRRKLSQLPRPLVLGSCDYSITRPEFVYLSTTDEIVTICRSTLHLEYYDSSTYTKVKVEQPIIKLAIDLDENFADWEYSWLNTDSVFGGLPPEYENYLGKLHKNGITLDLTEAKLLVDGRELALTRNEVELFFSIRNKHIFNIKQESETENRLLLDKLVSKLLENKQ